MVCESSYQLEDANRLRLALPVPDHRRILCMRVADHDRFTSGAAHGLGRTPKTARRRLLYGELGCWCDGLAGSIDMQSSSPVAM